MLFILEGRQLRGKRICCGCVSHLSPLCTVHWFQASKSKYFMHRVQETNITHCVQKLSFKNSVHSGQCCILSFILLWIMNSLKSDWDVSSTASLFPCAINHFLQLSADRNSLAVPAVAHICAPWLAVGCCAGALRVPPAFRYFGSAVALTSSMVRTWVRFAAQSFGFCIFIFSY